MGDLLYLVDDEIISADVVVLASAPESG